MLPVLRVAGADEAAGDERTSLDRPSCSKFLHPPRRRHASHALLKADGSQVPSVVGLSRCVDKVPQYVLVGLRLTERLEVVLAIACLWLLEHGLLVLLHVICMDRRPRCHNCRPHRRLGLIAGGRRIRRDTDEGVLPLERGYHYFLLLELGHRVVNLDRASRWHALVVALAFASVVQHRHGQGGVLFRVCARHILSNHQMAPWSVLRHDGVAEQGGRL